MNQLFQGDNLEILLNMPGGSIDLICTDPPFNTGKDWGAFDDRWEGGLDGYLKFMKPRLIECRRVLKDTGSLYLHCDPTASHYLKVMLDSVFGIDNLKREIIWATERPSGFKTNTDNWVRNHDTIYYYILGSKHTFNKQYEPYTQDYLEKFNQQDELGYYYIVNGRKRRIKNGFHIGSVWNDILTMQSLGNLEGNGYPTQKPVALYERMIKASSNQHDIVLDPFAGSGTTLDAAESLGRKWIGIDVGDEAIEIIQTRLRDRHGLMLEYELIRR